jgi:purine-binding chemotaxis protein CheW
MLVTRVGSSRCCIPVGNVVETLRPLAIEALHGTPAFVLGVSLIRGAAVPVVDLAAVIGAPGATGQLDGSRFVVLRVAARRVAALVDAVLDVRELPGLSIAELPPLLGTAGRGLVDAVGALDADLLVVLGAGRILPEDVWRKLDPHPEAG